ncbi:MAG: hypothetical protein R2939_23120 [Kofleriaceae bacterium]
MSTPMPAVAAPRRRSPHLPAALLARALAACKDKPETPPATLPPISGLGASATGSGSGGPLAGVGSGIFGGSGSGSAGAAGSAAPTLGAPPAEAPPPPSDPGPAYLGIDQVGLVKIEGGAVTPVNQHRYLFQDAEVSASGAIYVTGIGGLWEIEDGKATDLRPKGSFDSYDHVALAPSGAIWLLGSSGLATLDGGIWTKTPKETFEDVLLKDLVVDSSGRVWVATTKALWRQDGATWTRTDGTFTGTDQPFFGALAADGAGRVYVTSIRGIFVLDGGAWRKLGTAEDAGSTTYDELVVRSDGMVVASGGVDDLLIAPPGGVPITTDAPTLGLEAKRLDVLAVDGNGRVWLGTDHGLAVIDAAGKLLQQYRPGTLPGVTGKVSVVAVIGGGPALPAPSTAVTGNVVGKVLRDGQPVVGAAIELCASPSTMFRKTPCGDATLARAATTGKDGTFRLTDVPVGKHGFAIKPDDTWRILIGGECCAKLTAGADYDVGSITLDE